MVNFILNSLPNKIQIVQLAIFALKDFRRKVNSKNLGWPSFSTIGGGVQKISREGGVGIKMMKPQ